MTIYTHFSDSHKELYEEFFKPSLRKIYSKSDVRIAATYHHQTTENGTFMEQGWCDAMDIKLDIIIEAIRKHWNQTFIFADCDIQFFNPFVDIVEKELSSADLVCQEDRGSLCAGFFGCRGNTETLYLFSKIKCVFRQLVNDEVALNALKDSVKYRLLDAKQFYTIGNFFVNAQNTFIWDNQTIIAPPREMLIHHANYVVGTSNKVKLLQMIRQNYTDGIRL